jgi:photosystem II stability/assembly factor-like uncharacterized protein
MRALLAAASALLLGVGVLPAFAGQGVWTPVGPYGGTVGALAVAPGSGTIYAGTATSGLFRSSDGGATWQPLPKGPGGGEVMALSLVASQPSTLHVVVNDVAWRSDDGGGTWTRTAFSPSSSGLVAAAPSSSQIVYGSDGFSVFASGDGGATVHQVTRVSSLFVLISALAVSPLAATEVYAVTDHGLFKTPDGGATWAQLPVGAIPVSLAIDPHDPATLYAGTADGAFFASHDRGATWAMPGSGFGSAGSVDAIAADPATAGTLYAGVNGSSASGVWKSADGGASWTLAVATPRVDALAASAAAAGRIVAGLEPAGVLKSEDGGATWAPSNQGLTGTLVTAAAVDPFAAGTLYAAVYSHNQHNFDVTGIDDQLLPLGLQRSRDGGATWETADSGLDVTFVTKLLADPTRRGFLYAVASSGIYLSADGAGSWHPAGGDPHVLELFDVALDPKRPGTVYLIGGRIILGKPAYVPERSLDSGATWSNLSLAGTGSPTLDAVAVDPFLPAHVYFGGSGLLRSNHRGSGLARTGSGLPSNFLVYKLLADPGVTGRFYALMFAGTPAYGFWRSVDGGTTWTRSRAGLPPQRIQLLDLTADAATSTLFASSVLGVSISRNGGASWHPASAGLLGAAAGLLLDDPLDAGTILTAPELGGLWTYTAAR